MNLVLYFGIKLTTRKLKLYMHVKFCFRRRQIHLLATGLSGSRSSGFPRSGEGEGDGDPLDPRPGRRGEDVQVVPPLAQQVHIHSTPIDYINNNFIPSHSRPLLHHIECSGYLVICVFAVT